jgi:hypothetical protein
MLLRRGARSVSEGSLDGGNGLRDVRQSGSGAALLDNRSQPVSPAASSWPAKVAYSVCSGAVATVLGAVASLAVAVADRVAVWCAVAGATAAGAGLMWHSGLVSVWREAFSRWIAAVFSS